MTQADETSRRKAMVLSAQRTYAAMKSFSDTATEGALKAGIDEEIVFLIKVRVSQMNGCPFCIDLHTREALEAGAEARRLFALDGWRGTPSFDPAERAALDLAEAVTRLRDGVVGDAVYGAARDAFGADGVNHLIMIATVTNAWNRIAIASHMLPGAPRPRLN
ncbi:carboxymuconolactone decarboxylase family protein [Actinocrinis puniceicyclus]|uniref:Carboxymuconolactone decarboxylase family protein n=1 Tax=Actinocrinis puniceicyclus TaxID=977794 RepID=A0A8J8BBS1_9ACTN|nr:carboxymuconolactone decarboxylase family protein [Actinocrinis puniceicyclus]MBS2962376.1 carboxymuconolactone decarboxylase family protein [Actinocrinis puniceicyclus]